MRLTLFITLWIVVAGCRTANEAATDSSQLETEKDVRVTVGFWEPYVISDNGIHVIGAPLAFEIGAPLAFELVIENNSHVPVEFHNFVVRYDKLAFFTPQQVHLIAPGGQDVLLPYNRRDTSSGELFRVEAQDIGGVILIVEQFLLLREPGDYSFWVELKDQTGESYRSSTLTFQLEEVEPSIPANLVELRLAPLQETYPLSENVAVEVTFTNLADVPITFLKPQDGSAYGWISPIYDFSTLNEHGQRLPLPGGDLGLPPVYDETTMFTLEPGESSSFTDLVSGSGRIQNPGNYQVQLTYVVRTNKWGWRVIEESINWDEDVFVGRLESNSIDITIK